MRGAVQFPTLQVGVDGAMSGQWCGGLRGWLTTLQIGFECGKVLVGWIANLLVQVGADWDSKPVASILSNMTEEEGRDAPAVSGPLHTPPNAALPCMLPLRLACLCSRCQRTL